MKAEDTLLSAVQHVCGLPSQPATACADWRGIEELARRHAVLPLLGQYLGAIAPSPFSEVFREASVHAAHSAIQAKRLIHAIGAALRVAGVRVLLTKGIALSEWAYQGLVRQVGDIDLLVDPTSYELAQKVLRAQGLFPLRVNDCGEATSVEWRSANGLIVDLQPALLEPYFLAMPEFRELWDRRVDVATIDIPTLNPVDHLLYVLLHGLKHQWCRVGWIVDVAMIARHLGSAEFEELTQRSQRLSVARAASVGLELCREVLHFPDMGLGMASMHGKLIVRAIAKRYRQRLFAAVPNTTCEKLKNSAVHILACTGTRQRVRYIRGRVMNMRGSRPRASISRPAQSKTSVEAVSAQDGLSR